MKSSIHAIVGRSRRRIMLGGLVGAGVDVILAGSALLVAFGTLAQSFGLGHRGWLLFWLGLGLLSVAHAVHLVFRDASLPAVARRLDRSLGFKDRVSSSMAFAEMGSGDPFIQAHILETEKFLEAHADAAVPVPWPRRLRALAFFLVIGLVALFPHSDRRQLQADRQRHAVQVQRKAARQVVEQLADLKRRTRLMGLPKMSAMLARAEEALRHRMRILEPEPEQPRQEAHPQSAGQAASKQQTPRDDDKHLAGDSAIAGGASASDAPRLASQAQYRAIGKYDSFPEESYREVFAELDGRLLESDMSALQLGQLSEHLGTTADQLGNFGFFDDQKAQNAMGNMRGPKADMFEGAGQKALDGNLGALQMKAFGEFLNRYAAHLGDKALGLAHLEKNAKGKDSGGLLDMGLKPPKDATFALKGVTDKPQGPMMAGTPEQLAQLARQAGAASEVNFDPGQQPRVTGGGTHPGGQGAGAGGGGARAEAPQVLPQPSGGGFLPLKGQLADGQTVVQLIDAYGSRQLQPRTGPHRDFGSLFSQYAKGAEAQLNSEQVPLQMRDYVRDYFRSIRPDSSADHVQVPAPQPAE